MEQPVAIALYLYPDASNLAGIAARVLDALESNAKTGPTHWGHHERESLPYDRSDVLAGDPSSFFLRRKTSIKYSANGDFTSVPFLTFTFDKSTFAARWQDILDLSDRLAKATSARFGLLHIFRPAKEYWKTEAERMSRWLQLAAQPVPVRFVPNGPLALGMRTYFGGDILKMFTREALLATPGVATPVPSGIIRVDLAENLWSLTSSAATDLWVKAMAHLESRHAWAEPVFDPDHRTVDFKPSPAWTRLMKGA
jgi:hypothetical protein